MYVFASNLMFLNVLFSCCLQRKITLFYSFIHSNMDAMLNDDWWGLKLPTITGLRCHAVVPGTVCIRLNGWSEVLTIGLAVRTAKTSVTCRNFWDPKATSIRPTWFVTAYDKLPFSHCNISNSYITLQNWRLCLQQCKTSLTIFSLNR